MSLILMTLISTGFFSPVEELNDSLILSGKWEILLLQHFFTRMTLNLKFAVIFKQVWSLLWVYSQM